jgi:hypothetical protein
VNFGFGSLYAPGSTVRRAAAGAAKGSSAARTKTRQELERRKQEAAAAEDYESCASMFVLIIITHLQLWFSTQDKSSNVTLCFSSSSLRALKL